MGTRCMSCVRWELRAGVKLIFRWRFGGTARITFLACVMGNECNLTINSGYIYIYIFIYYFVLWFGSLLMQYSGMEQIRWSEFLLAQCTPMARCFSTIALVHRVHYNDVIMSAMKSQITGLTIVYSTVCSHADQREHQSSASLAFVWGIHRWPVNSPHKVPVTRKMFPFDDVIMLSSYRCVFSCLWVNLDPDEPRARFNHCYLVTPYGYIYLGQHRLR